METIDAETRLVQAEENKPSIDQVDSARNDLTSIADEPVVAGLDSPSAEVLPLEGTGNPASEQLSRSHRGRAPNDPRNRTTAHQADVESNIETSIQLESSTSATETAEAEAVQATAADPTADAAAKAPQRSEVVPAPPPAEVQKETAPPPSQRGRAKNDPRHERAQAASQGSTVKPTQVTEEQSASAILDSTTAEDSVGPG